MALALLFLLQAQNIIKNGGKNEGRHDRRNKLSDLGCFPRHVPLHAIAKTRKTSANRVVVDLIEAGIQAKEDEKRRFFALANRIAESDDPLERQRIKEELARMTFGD